MRETSSGRTAPARVTKSILDTTIYPNSRIARLPKFSRPLALLVRNMLQLTLYVASTQPRRLKYLIPPRGAAKHAIHELRSAVAQLPPLPADAAAEAERGWLYMRKPIRQDILRRDPRQFLTWRSMHPVVLWGESPAFASRIRRRTLMHEDPIGAPPLAWPHVWSSPTLIQHVHHLEQFELATGVTAANFGRIFEFGAGYGSLCRVIHRLGFRGEYTLFDFPEMCALQRYFLSQIGGTRQAQLKFLSDEQALAKYSAKGALFIATWSLSETPLRLREAVNPLLMHADAFLIAYHDIYRGEINNHEYFEHLQTFRPDVQWRGARINDLGDYYLFGRTTSAPASSSGGRSSPAAS